MLVKHPSGLQKKLTYKLFDMNSTHSLWFFQHLAVPSTQLAQNAERNPCDLVATVTQGPPQRLHEFCPHRLDVFVQEVWL